MNIFGIKLFGEKPKQATVEIGTTGTSIFGGYITGEDYVSELTGFKALDTYDKMRKSDGVVKASLLACELPIRAANWYIQPASDEDDDKEVADFISSCLFDKMSITWDDFLRQALLMLAFGFSVFEKVFQSVEFNGNQMIGWRKFAPRLQKTILKWQTEDGNDGITQMNMTGGQSVSIPIEKLLIFTHQKEGDNWLGISVLRSAYRPWFFKNHIEKINAMVFERQGLGIPYGDLPKNYSTKDKKNMEELLQNIRANESAYMIKPTDWNVAFMDMKGNTVKEPDETIRRYNREILISVLAQFLDLGSGQTGSRALSADHSSVFHNNLAAMAKCIQDVINKYAIKQLVDLNYTVNKYPTLEYSHIGLPRYNDVANALGILIEKGAIIPDIKLEKYLRQLLDLPEKPEIDDTIITSTPIGKKVDETPKEVDLENAGQGGINVKKKASEFIGWRPLTFAEQKVNLADINAKISGATDDLKKKLGDIIDKSVADLIRQFQMVLEATTSTEKRDRLRNIDVKYQGEYRKALYNSIVEVFQYGKLMASGEMHKDPPPTPANSLQLISKSADMLTDVMADDLLKAGKLALLGDLQKKQFSDTLGTIMKSIKDRADSIVLNASAINVGNALNQGRRASIVAYGDDIYALQRSEILDEATCNYCISIDSRIFRKNDAFTKVDIIHSNCRGLWVEIMKDEFEKPPIEGIPDSLKNKFEGLNNAGELLKPIPKPNSPASEMLKNKAIIDNIYQESVVGMKDMFKNSGIDIGKGVKLNNDMVKGRIDDIAQKLERSFGISESNNFRRNIENKTFEDYNDFETKVKDVLDKIINQ